MKALTGFSTEEQLQTYFENFKRISKNTNSQRRRIDEGVTGFINHNVPKYMVYALTVRPTGKYNFPGNLKELPPVNALEGFKDLIISVGSNDRCQQQAQDKDGAYYENRGIFRNPANCLYYGETFSGLSLDLHGFCACVRKSG